VALSFYQRSRPESRLPPEAEIERSELCAKRAAQSVSPRLQDGGGFNMSIEPEGWHIAAGPPLWDTQTKAFSFFLQKHGRERVLCVLTVDALERAVQSSGLSAPALTRIFDAHRQMIELRAAQKLNAGLFDTNGLVRIGAGDI
jgi:Protein of unknown function (DUF1488)